MPRVKSNFKAQLQRLFRPDAATRKLFGNTHSRGNVGLQKHINKSLDEANATLTDVTQTLDKKGRKMKMADRRILNNSKEMLETDISGMQNSLKIHGGKKYSGKERMMRRLQGAGRYYTKGTTGQLAARYGATAGGLIGVGVIADGINGGYGD